MNILLFTGKYSTSSIPFLKEFKNRLPYDKLIIFLSEPMNKSNSFSLLRILKNNKVSYMLRKVLQLSDAFLRARLIGMFPFMGVKYVHEYINREKAKYYNIDDINSGETIRIIRENQIDILAMYDCGQILKKTTIESASIACINVHPSLLPKYRGTSPIYWVLKNKEKETGVTIHLVDKGVDTGDIILQSKIDISPGMTEKMLTQRLSCLAAEMLFKVVDKFKKNTVRPTKQDNSKATYFNNLRQVY